MLTDEERRLGVRRGDRAYELIMRVPECDRQSVLYKATVFWHSTPDAGRFSDAVATTIRAYQHSEAQFLNDPFDWV